MSDLHPLDPRLADVQRRLAALCPREARLNVAQTLFRAGQASASSEPAAGRILWPLLTAASVLFSLALTAALLRQPAERIVYVERPAASTEQPGPSVPSSKSLPPEMRTRFDRVWLASMGELSWNGDWNYLRARQFALRFGVESLPTTGTFAANGHTPSLRYRDWRQGLGQDSLTFQESTPRSDADTPGALQGAKGGS